MAERLTKFNKTGWVLKLDEPQNEFEARQQLMSKFKFACEKLGKIEDLLEKYGIESVEELDKKIAYYIDKIDLEAENEYLKKAIEKQNMVSKSISKDRDTWKRACELACEYMCKFVIPCPDIHRKECKSFCDLNKADCYQDYFYQQAKKEGNDE